ncbi:MAG: MATE family efflux transporter [Rikenellaceae bacterium]|nr:MATE family efflux transporter [Rikenellaceae bacterium]
MATRLQNFFVNKSYYKSNILLATPIILANAGQGFVSVVDKAMVGRLGADPLAAEAFAGVLVLNTMVFGMGMSYGLTPLVGKAYSAGNDRQAAFFYQNSLSLNTITGAILSLGLIAATPLLDYMGQQAHIVAMARPFYILIAASILPYMIFLSFKQFMEGIGNTTVAMGITIFCNLLNIFLNWVLIYGKMGIPAMGATGAALATLISRIMMPLIFWIYLLTHHKYGRYFRFFRIRNLTKRCHRQLLAIGTPISLQMVIEMFALSMTAIMMGWIGPKSLAANQIVLTVMSFMFMVSSGIAGAVTVLVSHSIRARDIVNYAKAGMQMSALYMFAASLLYIFAGDTIASLFNSDPEVIAISARVFLIAAIFEISDGIQVTALGALRGIADVLRPMIYAVVIYLFVNIPVGYLLGFVLELGEEGIWTGFLIGVTSAAILFNLRLRDRVRQRRLFV